MPRAVGCKCTPRHPMRLECWEIATCMLRNVKGERLRTRDPSLHLNPLVLYAVLLGCICIFGGKLPGTRAAQQNVVGEGRANSMDMRIIGGVESQDDKFPWMASLTVTSDSGSRNRCGGIVISSRLILTAAHCLLNDEKTGYVSSHPVGRILAAVGCTDLESSDCQEVNIETFVVHPCYAPGEFFDHDDIAVLSTEDDMAVVEFALVDGVSRSSSSLALQNGDALWLLGWGKTSNENTVGSTKLMEVEVPLATRSACEGANPWAAEHGTLDFETVLCTGGEAGKDSCGGDSGGPAVRESGGEWWVVGVLSKGSERPLGSSGCAEEGRYGVYTRTESFGAFISAAVEGWELACRGCPCSDYRLQPPRAPAPPPSVHWGSAQPPAAAAQAGGAAEAEQGTGGEGGEEGWVFWAGVIAGGLGLACLCCSLVLLGLAARSGGKVQDEGGRGKASSGQGGDREAGRNGGVEGGGGRRGGGRLAGLMLGLGGGRGGERAAEQEQRVVRDTAAAPSPRAAWTAPRSPARVGEGGAVLFGDSSKRIVNGLTSPFVNDDLEDMARMPRAPSMRVIGRSDTAFSSTREIQRTRPA